MGFKKFRSQQTTIIKIKKSRYFHFRNFYFILGIEEKYFVLWNEKSSRQKNGYEQYGNISTILASAYGYSDWLGNCWRQNDQWV